MKKQNVFKDKVPTKELETADPLQKEISIEEMMQTKLQTLVAERANFFADLSQFLYKKGTSNKRLLKILQFALLRNTDFRDKIKLTPGNESALGEKLRGILDDEMTIGYLQFSLASQLDDELKEKHVPEATEIVNELKEEGIDIPDYAKKENTNGE